MSTVEERSFVEAARREKRAALEALGVQPFAYRYERTHTGAEALAAYRDEMGETGPRSRSPGGSSPGVPRARSCSVTSRTPADASRSISGGRCSATGYELVELLDLDDHVGVAGRLFRTKAGEVTVRASELTLLAKSLRPLPRGKTQTGSEGTVTFGGLTDPELRYRQRYADLAVHPGCARRSSCSAPRPPPSSGGSSTSAGSSRSRPRFCSRSMAVPRRSRS